MCDKIDPVTSVINQLRHVENDVFNMMRDCETRARFEILHEVHTSIILAKLTMAGYCVHLSQQKPASE